MPQAASYSPRALGLFIELRKQRISHQKRLSPVSKGPSYSDAADRGVETRGLSAIRILTGYVVTHARRISPHPSLSFYNNTELGEGAPLPYDNLVVSLAAAVNSLESLYIFGISAPLGPCAVTRSPQDGCFQAHLRAVTARRCPFSLRLFCRTLADDLGCFPRVPGPSHPGTDSRMSTSWYSEFPRDWYRGRPTRTL